MDEWPVTVCLTKLAENLDTYESVLEDFKKFAQKDKFLDIKNYFPWKMPILHRIVNVIQELALIKPANLHLIRLLVIYVDMNFIKCNIVHIRGFLTVQWAKANYVHAAEKVMKNR